MSLKERLATLDTDAAMRLVADVRPVLFSKVTELRAVHLKSEGELSDATRDSYADDAKRVVAAGGDPMNISGTKATFKKLRAACLWKARQDLRECLARADRARKKGGTGDIDALCIYDEKLPEIEQRLAYFASLRFDATKATRREKTHNQRPKLGRLPDDWISQVHHRTRGGKYGEAVAVGILIPVRPAEIANRIHVKIDAFGALVFEVKGSKVQKKGSGVAAHTQGIGQPVRWVTLSEVDADRQAAFDWLLERVKASGGNLTIGKGMTGSGISTAFSAMSRRLFSQSKSPPSFYALRHAASAELKASGIGSVSIARGMGHASVLSQKAYGTKAQARGGYVVSTGASNEVRTSKTSAQLPSAFRKNDSAVQANERLKPSRPRP